MRSGTGDVVLHEFTILENRNLIAVTVFGNDHRFAGRPFEDRQRLDAAPAGTPARSQPS
jgi:hypothetical protein